MDKYKTAQGFYEYIRKAMPWQDPGYLTDQEYWNITAFLLQANGFTLPKEPLSGENGADTLIGTGSSPIVETVVPTVTAVVVQPAGNDNRILKMVGLILAGSAVVAGLYVFWVMRKK
jgi:hypothetical protein